MSPRPPTTLFDPASPLALVAPMIASRRFRAMIRHRERALVGNDHEALHDLRVNGLRLHAVLELLRPAFPKGTRRDAARLKKVLRKLGAAREFDVLLDAITDATRACPVTDLRALHLFQAMLQSERDRSRSGLRDALEDRIFRKGSFQFQKRRRRPDKTT